MTKYGITPETIGIFATLCGILLTIIMIYGHIRRIRNESAERKEKEIIARIEREKAEIELAEMRRKLLDPAQ
nr:MAG TPA: Sporulation protein YhaL [Caudoviricetes sp.]